VVVVEEEEEEEEENLTITLTIPAVPNHLIRLQQPHSPKQMILITSLMMLRKFSFLFYFIFLIFFLHSVSLAPS
jgi:hypothetical protein